jgi:hypothetical protein
MVASARRELVNVRGLLEKQFFADIFYASR